MVHPEVERRWTTAIDRGSALFPWVPDIDMQPSPRADTLSVL
jgi:hypothetical protein